MHTPPPQAAAALIVALAVATSLAGPVRAGVVLLPQRPARIQFSIVRIRPCGHEDWSSSTLGPNDAVIVPDPLEPGVASGPFPGGTNPGDGHDRTIEHPRWKSDDPLARRKPGRRFRGFPGDSRRPDQQHQFNTSFDMIFALPMTKAVSFTPLVFDEVASGNAGTATIRVYDTANVLLGETVKHSGRRLHQSHHVPRYLDDAGRGHRPHQCVRDVRE